MPNNHLMLQKLDVIFRWTLLSDGIRIKCVIGYLKNESDAMVVVSKPRKQLEPEMAQ